MKFDIYDIYVAYMAYIVGSVQERTICKFFSKMSYHLERAVHITIYQEKNTDHEIS